MFEYIIDSFAVILTKGDVIHLFNELIDHFGNRSKAADIAGVTPAATYRWKDAKYIKSETKEKVLKAVLEYKYLVALEYLLKRTSDKHTDILRTMLMDLYTEAITTDTPDRFKEVYRKFDEIRTHFRGTIRDNIEEEVAEMSHSIEERAEELGVPVTEPSINDLTAKELVDTLPLIVMEYKSNRGNPSEAAKNLKLPESSIMTFWNTFNSMMMVKPPERDIESQKIYLGAAAGDLPFITYLKREMLKPPTFGVMLTGLGAVLTIHHAEERREEIMEYSENASAPFWLQHTTPMGRADSLVIECFERGST